MSVQNQRWDQRGSTASEYFRLNDWFAVMNPTKRGSPRTRHCSNTNIIGDERGTINRKPKLWSPRTQTEALAAEQKLKMGRKTMAAAGLTGRGERTGGHSVKSFNVVIKMFSYRHSHPSEKCFRAQCLARREACGEMEERTVVETFISKPHKQAIKLHRLNYINASLFSLSLSLFKENTIFYVVLKVSSKMSWFCALGFNNKWYFTLKACTGCVQKLNLCSWSSLAKRGITVLYWRCSVLP